MESKFLVSNAELGAAAAFCAGFSLPARFGEFFWYWCGTFDSTQAALDAIASPEGQAGADVPNYYHDVPLFMVVET